MKRKVIGALMALMLCLGIGVVAANGAQASTETVGSCGAGYSQIDVYTLWDPDTVHINGYLHLYYGGGQNCAMLEKNRWVGTPSYTAVEIKLHSSSTWHPDTGNYRYYAGPVYSGPSAGQCIDLFADMTDPAGNFAGLLNISGVHCG